MDTDSPESTTLTTGLKTIQLVVFPAFVRCLLYLFLLMRPLLQSMRRHYFATNHAVVLCFYNPSVPQKPSQRLLSSATLESTKKHPSSHVYFHRG